MLKQSSETVELVVFHRLYKSCIRKVKSDAGILNVEEQIFLKEMRILHTFERSSLGPISQHVTVRNAVSKRRCIVFDKNTQTHYQVGHSYEDVKKALVGRGSPIVGFKKLKDD